VRLPRPLAFWAVAFSFATVTSFSTAPSALYGFYERQEGFSSLTITVVYAAYAIGIVLSLMLIGHLSDWYGRRTLLVPGLRGCGRPSAVASASGQSCSGATSVYRPYRVRCPRIRRSNDAEQS
jgi:MFS family permease